MFETLESLDRSLLLAINSYHAPWLDSVMWFFSLTWPTFVIVFLVAWLVYRKYDQRKAIEFLLGCAIVAACTDISSNAVKHNVKRLRPTHNLEIRETIHVVRDYRGGQYGFFSGHAANTFGVVTFIFLCVNWVRRRYMFLIGLYPFVVVYSRMYLGVHYPSDILFGIMAGLLFGWLGFLVMNKYFLKLDEHKPDEHPI